MAISAPVYSAQYAKFIASPQSYVPSTDWNSKLRVSIAELTFTSAGFTTASAGDLKLIRMPAGKVRILGDLSRIVCPAGTSTSDLDIGYAAHVKEDGTAVNADEDGYAASLDVGGGAINAALATGTVFKHESKNGFDIVASFDTANSPASGTMYLIIVYQVGN